MNRLVEHIERLLLMHDCVIIPDFGGFVLQTISSSHNTDATIFFPPKKEVVFNQSLTHNDGLLVESYMRLYEMDFDKAQQLVKNDVRLLKDTLENESELQFGKTGIFVTDDERLIFMATKDTDIQYNIAYYGLPVFHFLPLLNRRQSVSAAPIIPLQPADNDSVEEDENEEDENKNILYKIPISKTFIRAAVATAAAILLFLFISTPVKDVNKDSYKASFVPQELMPKKTVDDIINEAFEKSQESQATNPSSLQGQRLGSGENTDLADNTTIPEAKPAETTTATATTSTATETKSSPAKPLSTSTKTAVKPQPKNYYVIIGSFDTKTRANNFIKTLKGQEAKTAGILVKDGRVRVYAQGFATEASANQYMNKLQQTTQHKQAWVYNAKN